MKSILLFVFLLTSTVMIGQDTYFENFDVAGSWVGGTMTGYNAKTYTNPAAPLNDQFSSNSAVRENTTANVRSLPYAWRVNYDVSGRYLRYECAETVHAFEVYMARWDNSPVPTVQIRYSLNSGTSYTNIDTVVGGDFSGDKVYQLYSFTFSSPISPEASQNIFIEFVTLSGERMLYDDFQLTYGVSTVNNPTAFNAVPFSTTQNDLTWGLNGNSDSVLIAYNTSNTFGVPTGVYYAGDPVTDGGTILYKGTGTSTSHTGLPEDTEYFYTAWSFTTSHEYSTGVLDSATTLKPEPSSAPAGFDITATGITIACDWTDATGEQLPDAYLIRISEQNNISAPVDGVPIADDLVFADGAGDVNVPFGTQAYTFFRLQETTNYYLKIFPYTNSGAFIDYLTVGIPSAINDTTQSIIVTKDFEDNLWPDWTLHNVASDKVWLNLSGAGAYGTSRFASMSGYYASAGVLSNDWLISPALDLDLFTDDKLIFFNSWNYGTNTNELTVKYSTDYIGGDPTMATWTELVYTKATTSLTWVPSGFIDLSEISGSAVYIAFQYLSESFDNAARTWRVDEVEITGTELEAIDNPTNFVAIAVSGNEISLSWDKNLNSDDVVLAWNSVNIFGKPEGPLYEGSEIPGGGFVIYRGQEESFIHGGLNPETLYYYKAWSIDPSDIYSSGATAEASTFFPEPASHPTGFQAVANGFSQITVSWTDSDADHYLVKGSSISYANIIAPVDFVQQNDSALVKNIDAITQTAVFTGLMPSTTYYFKIFPYNGTGVVTNYKIDGIVPEASATTTELDIDLIISEVADPLNIGNAKYVEILNIGNSDINFGITPVCISRQSNGTTWANIVLTGTINAGETYVAANNSTDFSTGYSTVADMYNANINGNGDDGYFLYYGTSQATGTLIDAFGVIGQDGTGMPWEYEDSKAVRKRSVTAPNSTWTESEWVIPAAAQTKDMTPDFHNGNVTWQGTASTNWNTKGMNWNSPNGYIPDASCNVIIPFTDIINFPNVTEASAVNEVQIESGSTVIVSGTGSLQVVGQP